MKTAIIGCGRIASVHLSAVQQSDGVEVCGWCDRDGWRAQQMADQAGQGRAYTDLEALLAEEAPTAVHILTPPDSHADLAIRAMNAGCHALIEKPMALSVEESLRMVSAAEQNGVLLSPNHNYLFKPSVARARELVANGTLGEVAFVSAYYGLSGEANSYTAGGGRSHWAWRLPGGAFTNFLPHLIYLQQAFLGRIEAVEGVTLAPDPSTGKLPTELTVLLRGARASGVICFSMRARPYAKFVEVYGTRGTVHADLVRELCTVHMNSGLPRMLSKAQYSLSGSWQNVTGTAVNTLKVLSRRMRNYPGLHQQVRDFYEAIRAQGQAPVTGEDGAEMVRVMAEIWDQCPALHSPWEELSKSASTTDPPRSRAEKKLHDSSPTGRVLVTGASGFLGHRLVAALSRSSVPVTALVRDPGGVSAELESQATLVQGDIRDADSLAEAMQGVTTVVHCAAVTTNQATWSEHENTNIRGSENVFRAALEAGVQHVVHISSVLVYGLDTPSGGRPMQESDPFPTKVDHWAYYQRSKHEAEQLAWRYQNEFDLPVTVVRLGILYGPSQEKALRKDLLRLGPLRLTIGRGKNPLPFTYIDNAIDALLLTILSQDSVGQAFNVIDDPQITYRECTRLQDEVTGARSTSMPVPPFVLSSAARLLEMKARRSGSQTPPRLSRFVIRTANRKVRYDTSKAHEQLGWEPEIELEEGLRRSLVNAE